MNFWIQRPAFQQMVLLLALGAVFVFSMMVILVVYFAPYFVVYLQHLDILYNFEHYASSGEGRIRSQTPFGIVHHCIFKSLIIFGVQLMLPFFLFDQVV